MKSLLSKSRSLILIGTVSLLILAYPSTFYARGIGVPERSSVKIADHTSFAETHSSGVATVPRERGDVQPSLLDQDIRVRVATVLIGDPATRKSAEAERVPLTVLVITAPVILDV